MSDYNLILYFKKEPEKDRIIPGDHLVIPRLRELIKGKQIGGVEKVFINLCKGLDSLGIKYKVNTPFSKLKATDRPIVLGTGKYILQGYTSPNPIIAGIGLMTHPSEWHDLISSFPVIKYLQHCKWAADVYKPYYGDQLCDTWFAGIETEKWKPSENAEKKIDILIYNKVRWNKDEYRKALINPIKDTLEAQGISYQEIVYGSYKENDYFQLLNESRGMIFLCEHESQGFACCEALSMNVPVLAWDQGFCLDPNRFKWGVTDIPATSVPFFDARCGERFKNFSEFSTAFSRFHSNLTTKKYEPREYILENLTLEKSALRMLEIVSKIK